MQQHFLKIPPLNKSLDIFKTEKKTMKLIQKKTISNQKLNQWLKTYKMSLINKKNKQKVINFAKASAGSWKAKNAQKVFS